MKTLYFDCALGASADMIAAALLELLDDRDEFLENFNRLDLHGIKYAARKTERNGMTGLSLSFSVETPETSEPEENLYEDEIDDDGSRASDSGEKRFGLFRRSAPAQQNADSEETRPSRRRRGRTLADIEKIIDDFPIPSRVRDDARAIYEMIAETEADTKRCGINEVKLHTRGGMDVISSVVMICWLINTLGADSIHASDICVGTGYVKTPRGMAPVPEPNVAKILRDIPTFGGKLSGEMCSFTGAAVLKYYVSEYEPMPGMSVKQMGCGLPVSGQDKNNAMRIFFGDIIETSATGEVAELKCVCPISEEEAAFLKRLLVQSGALDAYTAAVSTAEREDVRELTCVCPTELTEDMVVAIARHTGAERIRRAVYMDYALEKREYSADTSLGKIRVLALSGYGADIKRPDPEDVRAAAYENDLAYRDALGKILSELK